MATAMSGAAASHGLQVFRHESELGSWEMVRRPPAPALAPPQSRRSPPQPAGVRST